MDKELDLNEVFEIISEINALQRVTIVVVIMSIFILAIHMILDTLIYI